MVLADDVAVLGVAIWFGVHDALLEFPTEVKCPAQRCLCIAEFFELLDS